MRHFSRVSEIIKDNTDLSVEGAAREGAELQAIETKIIDIVRGEGLNFTKNCD
jgi:hypothetical protein